MSMLVPRDPERDAQSRTMNRLLLQGIRRDEKLGALARFPGVEPPTDDAPRADHMARLLADREVAMKANDDAALYIAERRIDRLVEGGRAARIGGGQAGPLRDGQGRFTAPDQPGFDGGVRRRPPPAPARFQLTPNQLMAQAFTLQRRERIEREDDPGHTVIVK